MRVAIIDLGTNSVRFDVHQIGANAEVKQLHREKLLIRLGQNVFTTGKLDSNAVRRTLQAFNSFRRTADNLHVDKVVAFGTSALREANDSEKLLKKIRASTGIQVKIISGEEEAKFIAHGILRNEKSLKGRFALVDIGGGSTEITICEGREILHSTSFPLGTARLQQIFLKSSPPPEPKKGERHAVEALRSHIKSVLLSKFISEDWPKVDRVIGSSGTVRALGRVLRKNSGKKTYDRDELKRLVKNMATMTTSQLLNLPGMEAKRVDMILSGAILLEECLSCLKASKVQVTDYSLRDGILDEEVRMVKQRKGSHLPFHIPGFYQMAERFGCTEVHTRQVAGIAETLFDQTKKIHGLNVNWKPYLTVAAILHDVGEAVTPSHHGRHSYYIVKNANLPSMDEWEAEFVGQLCLHHAGSKLSAKDLEFTENKTHRNAFVKLLALLRIADALDRGHKGGLRIVRTQIDRKLVTITIASKGAADLEVLRVEQKRDLFEEVFKRHLIVKVAQK